MIEEPFEEDAALSALGLLCSEDTARLESEAARIPELQALLREFQDAAGQLAHVAPSYAAPPSVRARLLHAIESEKRSTVTARPVAWLPWALAAALALAAGLLALERAQLRREIAALNARDEFSQLRIATLSSQIDGAPGSVGAVAWDPGKQRGILTIEKLPPLGPAQDYQLWVIDPQYKQPVSGGLVRTDEKGGAHLVFTVEVPIHAADKFAVSREPKGGAAGAPGPLVLLGQ